jgi:hypothetical protein
MLSVKEFSNQYNVCPSWVRRQIKAGHLRSKLIKGRYHIAPKDAERWLSEQSHRGRVRNVSRPQLPAVVLGDADFRILLYCGRGYVVQTIEARINMEWRVSRLRARGFAIDQVDDGDYCRYRLKDTVEIELDDGHFRFGPHPDLWDLQ